MIASMSGDENSKTIWMTHIFKIKHTTNDNMMPRTGSNKKQAKKKKDDKQTNGIYGKRTLYTRISRFADNN